MQVGKADMTAISEACFPGLMPCYMTGDEYLLERSVLNPTASTPEATMWFSLGVIELYWVAGVVWAWVSVSHAMRGPLQQCVGDAENGSHSRESSPLAVGQADPKP